MIKGLTFSNQKVLSKGDGTLHNAIFGDDFKITDVSFLSQGNRITITDGYLAIAGRVIQVDGNTVISLNPTVTNGYGRLVLEINLNKISTTSEFEQVTIKDEYSTSTNFNRLTQEDINNSGAIYQAELCRFKVSNSASGSMISSIKKVSGFLPTSGGTMTGELNIPNPTIASFINLVPTGENAITINYSQVIKIPGAVLIKGSATIKSYWNSGNVIAQIPVGYRPSQIIQLQGFCCDGSGTLREAIIDVDADGFIKCYPQSGGGQFQKVIFQGFIPQGY